MTPRARGLRTQKATTTKSGTKHTGCCIRSPGQRTSTLASSVAGLMTQTPTSTRPGPQDGVRTFPASGVLDFPVMMLM